MSQIKNFLLAKSHSPSADPALLLLRVGVGLLMLPHGWKKLQRFRSEGPGDFYNFMGLDSEISIMLIIMAEFFCSILLIHVPGEVLSSTNPDAILTKDNKVMVEYQMMDVIRKGKIDGYTIFFKP